MFSRYFVELCYKQCVSQRFSLFLQCLITYEEYEKDADIFIMGDSVPCDCRCRFNFYSYC